MDTQEPTFPEDFEFGLANTRMLQFAGTMDARNRYVPTVMLSIDEPMTSPDCSGILVSPRLVLTLGAAFVRGAR
ncbi:MAG: hypothetical protein JXB05_27780 [Myxococcaceae bacterium]|nr:hypothetical protein [Myxococcaceae bacterium]